MSEQLVTATGASTAGASRPVVRESELIWNLRCHHLTLSFYQYCFKLLYLEVSVLKMKKNIPTNLLLSVIAVLIFKTESQNSGKPKYVECTYGRNTNRICRWTIAFSFSMHASSNPFSDDNQSQDVRPKISGKILNESEKTEGSQPSTVHFLSQSFSGTHDASPNNLRLPNQLCSEPMDGSELSERGHTEM